MSATRSPQRAGRRRLNADAAIVLRRGSYVESRENPKGWVDGSASSRLQKNVVWKPSVTGV